MSRNWTKEEASRMGKKGGSVRGEQMRVQKLEKQKARQHLIRKIEEHTEQLFEAWRDAALGHFVEVETPDGKVNVYKKSPDAKAIKDMFDRAFGKPDQKVLIDLEAEQRIDTALDQIASATIIDITPDEPSSDTDTIPSEGEAIGDSA